MWNTIQASFTRLLIPLFIFSVSESSIGATFSHSKELLLADQYTLVGKKHLVNDIPAIDVNGNINVVVEIPTGSNEKWEVEKETGYLKWEFKKDKPRVVSYLGYPGNYGMIPGTLLPKELGGDGDPLDVIILGAAVPRGSIINVRLIGVLKMLDGGEQDDKLVATSVGSQFEEITTIEELKNKFIGVSNIIEIWFSNYKGPNKIVVNGFAEKDEAREILDAAINAYNKRH